MKPTNRKPPLKHMYILLLTTTDLLATRYLINATRTLQHCTAHLQTGGVSGEADPCARIATHCNTLQHTATHCNTLHRTAALCNTPRNWRWYSRGRSVCCYTLQHTATYSHILQHTATHLHRYSGGRSVCCSTLQHTATYCNINLFIIIKDTALCCPPDLFPLCARPMGLAHK